MKLIISPRCGFGNRLRVLSSALALAEATGVRVEHTWREDTPVKSQATYAEEPTVDAMHPGRLFMENDAIISSQDAGYDVDLLLCEHDNVAQNSRVSFKKKAIVGRHRLNGANISAAQTILWHTSLPVYGVDQDRRASYAKFFKPRSTFTSEVRRLSAPIGPYVGLHLRSDVRTWHRVAEWTLAEAVSLCARTCKRADINRVIIVSDLVDTTDVDEALQSVGIHARRAT